jgi:hypothetical protein
MWHRKRWLTRVLGVCLAFVAVGVVKRSNANPTKSIMRAAIASALNLKKEHQENQICHTNSEKYLAFVGETARAQEQDAAHSTNFLYSLCKENAQCRKLYALDGVTNSPVNERLMFRYLTPWHDANEPLTRVLDIGNPCTNSDATQNADASTIASNASNAQSAKFVTRIDSIANNTLPTKVLSEAERAFFKETLKRELLMQLLVHAHDDGNVQCASNERFIFSPATGEGRCACAASDSDCLLRFRRGEIGAKATVASAITITHTDTQIALYVIAGCVLFHTLTALWQRYRQIVGMNTLIRRVNKKTRDMSAEQAHNVVVEKYIPYFQALTSS